MMKDNLAIGLVGTGKMGREVEKLAEEAGHRIIARYDIEPPFTKETADPGVDVYIEFTQPDAVVEHIQTAVAISKPMVIGTTGWYDKLQEIRSLVETADVGIIYASNFSLGVNLFFKMVEFAAEVMGRFDDFDAYVHEFHHRGKPDSPSGTALTIAELMLKRLKGKQEILTQSSHGKIDLQQLHVTSTRSGAIPGTHIIGFESPADSIELKHTARNRAGFAAGAIQAARWIVDKKGFYSFTDLIDEQLKL